MKKNKLLWGARFRKPMAETALRFSSSIELDRHLYKEDISGSIAHAEMLAAANIITRPEAERIRKALLEIQKEVEKGTLELPWPVEDIHTAVEKRLVAKLGPLGGKLHTARSRNDQVALDERMYLRKSIDEIRKAIRQLQRALLRSSKKYVAAVMPGYTHLQHAQPVLLSHHLLAYVVMLQRDSERMEQCRNRLNYSPLGAGALAGTSLPIDMGRVARSLKFDGIVENSLDAVSDRDYLIEFAAGCSLIMMHLSRLCEEIVLWSTKEFGFVTIDDAYATGSSMLPQKKNPDIAELVRGKTGRVYGNLVNLLTVMKGLPLTYNRDMQEDKLPLIDTAHTVQSSLRMLAEMFSHTRFNVNECESRAATGDLFAADIAEYLVARGVPFRKAHQAVGKLVQFCERGRKSLPDLSLAELRRFSPKFQSDIFPLLNPRTSVSRKRSAGSTSPVEVRKQIRAWERRLASRI